MAGTIVAGAGVALKRIAPGFQCRLSATGHGVGMPVYVLAQISIHDKTRYGRYAARFPQILARYGGTLLVADTAVQVAEGDWPHDNVVLLRFDDRRSFSKWANSPEYQEISRDRQASTTGVVLVLKGL